MRLVEDQKVQEILFNPEMGQTVMVGNEGGHQIDDCLKVGPETGSVQINFFMRMQPSAPEIQVAEDESRLRLTVWLSHTHENVTKDHMRIMQS